MNEFHFTVARNVFSELNWYDYPDLVCPFCSSVLFSISVDDDGLYYFCHGCLATGGIYSYISKYYQLSPSIYQDFELMETIIRNRVGDELESIQKGKIG